MFRVFVGSVLANSCVYPMPLKIIALVLYEIIHLKQRSTEFNSPKYLLCFGAAELTLLLVSYPGVINAHSSEWRVQIHWSPNPPHPLPSSTGGLWAHLLSSLYIEQSLPSSKQTTATTTQKNDLSEVCVGDYISIPWRNAFMFAGILQNAERDRGAPIRSAIHPIWPVRCHRGSAKFSSSGAKY